MDSIRVMMTRSTEMDSGGGTMQLAAGSFYLLPVDAALSLIGKGAAYEDGDPPVASDGTVFEGGGAHDELAAYAARLEAAAQENATDLSSVDFASDAARQLAADNDLAAEDFDFEPSGSTGFTVADVRSVLGDEEG